MASATRLLALTVLAGLLSCRSADRRVVVSVAARPGVDLGAVTWQPATAVRRVERRPDRLDLTLDDDLPAALSLRAPGACPREVPLSDVRIGERREAEITPWIDLGEDRPQIGSDRAFEVNVRPGCREAVAGRITWKVISGSLPELRVEQNGFRVRGRTARLDAARPGPLPWGIVPLSPATRGAVTLEATWEGVGPTTRRVLQVAAAVRATGVPAIAVGQRVILGGEGFRVTERPPGSRAEVSDSSFQPDASGRWVLVDARGDALALRAGRHADTPLDCGRAECHASAAKGAAVTRMTSVLARGLRGDFGPDYDPACAIACHAVGEPGLADGGFMHIARDLGQSPLPTGSDAWNALPRALRRLGGVGCTTCHGPGAIPERAARWTVLRTDVCAVCHDAPPRYGHVAAWRSTRMSRTAPSRETRAGACAGCHTTAGFLALVGVRPASASDGGPDEASGIGCAACHAPHAAATERALVRKVALPKGLEAAAEAGVSVVCLRCHAPEAGERLPSASAAVLWARGPHARVKDGCVGCHAAGAPVSMGPRAAQDPGAPQAPEAAVERGKGHAFRVDRARCSGCHECPQNERPDAERRLVAERASALWATLVKRGVVKIARDGAPHARAELTAPEGSAEARAAYAVMMVREDPAAGAHGAAEARRMLDEAEGLLGKAK